MSSSVCIYAVSMFCSTVISIETTKYVSLISCLFYTDKTPLAIRELLLGRIVPSALAFGKPQCKRYSRDGLGFVKGRIFVVQNSIARLGSSRLQQPIGLPKLCRISWTAASPESQGYRSELTIALPTPFSWLPHTYTALCGKSND